MFKRAEGQLHEEEASLARKSAELEARLAQAVQASGASDIAQLPEAVKDELRAIYAEQVEVRRSLREVRRRIRRDIDRLGRRVTMANLAA